MGGVLFEALHWGLPVITAARGGPDFIVDDSCGIRVPVTDPERYPRDIAAAVRRLAGDPALRRRLGAGARERIAGFGTWEETASRLIELYRQTIAAHSGRGSAHRAAAAPARSASRRSARAGRGGDDGDRSHVAPLASGREGRAGCGHVPVASRSRREDVGRRASPMPVAEGRGPRRAARRAGGRRAEPAEREPGRAASA